MSEEPKPDRRSSADYKNYPTSGMFRFHGAAKDYMAAWNQFLNRETDEEPAPFTEFAEEWSKQFRPFNRSREMARRVRERLFRQEV